MACNLRSGGDSRFQHIIRKEADIVNRLQDDVHAAYDARGRHPGSVQDWQRACERFRAHVSEVDHWIDQASPQNLSKDAQLRDFVITFLEMNPIYFRSGYKKEMLLRHLAAASLTNEDVARLHVVLIDAVKRRGRREFKRYCRLATAIATEEFRAKLDELSGHPDKAVRSRAAMMLRYLHPQSESSVLQGDDYT